MYIPKEERKIVDESGSNISKYEHLVYAVSVFILNMWNTAPNDNTIAVITKELVVDQKNSTFIRDLRQLLSGSLTVADIHTACHLAYEEFYQRVVRLHRAAQCRENGDLDGYLVAMKPLLAKLSGEIQKEAGSGLLLPGVKQ